MIITRNLADVRHLRGPRMSHFFEGFRTDYITPAADGASRLDAYLIEQAPLYKLQTHYHTVHQFQVVARGNGTLGRHALAPFAVHYTSPESGYGPIVAGPQGLWYYTLRVVHDTGAWLLPQQRDSMQRGLKKRQRVADGPRLASEEELQALRDTGLEPLFPDDAEGLGAWFLRLPPHASLEIPQAERGAGRYHIVAGGSMCVGDVRLAPLGLAFSDEPGFAITAGPEGLETLVVQFPRDALEP